MKEYIIYTTVDITPTGVINNNNKVDNFEHRRNQQRNYDTLCQVISLRANIYNPDVTIEYGRYVNFFNPILPEFYKVWVLTFFTDIDGVFGENHSALLDDLHMVPIVPALDETVPQFPPYFISYGDLKNIAVG